MNEQWNVHYSIFAPDAHYHFSFTTSIQNITFALITMLKFIGQLYNLSSQKYHHNTDILFMTFVHEYHDILQNYREHRFDSI